MSERDDHEELYGLTGLGRSLGRALAELVPGEPATRRGHSAAQGRVRRRVDPGRPGGGAPRGPQPARAGRRAGRALVRRARRRRVRALRGRRSGLSQPVPERRLVPRGHAAHGGARRRPRPRRRAPRRAPQDQRRVRQRQPHGAAARGPRALRVDGRRALPPARLRRPRGDPRVLRRTTSARRW